MDKPGVRVEGEDDRLVCGKVVAILYVGQAVRVVAVGDELEEIDDVDEADLQAGQVLPRTVSMSVPHHSWAHLPQ